MTQPDTQHVDYTTNTSVWRRCRDAAAGQRAIKAGQELYLLRLSGQDNTGYASYLDRA
ncbi:hypothetical protein [Spirosoma sp. KUDC1026]|uniref:hypothetical protein n=1 Tax=Spirosoma sp. KUDC1026 TaxID=2745947 RepID=UPI00159B8AEA|nr:hypothetical protein [Spirosoma sp. KUDC1026]QKZ15914.1 hypothetical protein HU175_24515 [Spirosoma sp. KUDC1026]